MGGSGGGAATGAPHVSLTRVFRDGLTAALRVCGYAQRYACAYAVDDRIGAAGGQRS